MNSVRFVSFSDVLMIRCFRSMFAQEVCVCLINFGVQVSKEKSYSDVEEILCVYNKFRGCVFRNRNIFVAGGVFFSVESFNFWMPVPF